MGCTGMAEHGLLFVTINDNFPLEREMREYIVGNNNNNKQPLDGI